MKNNQNLYFDIWRKGNFTALVKVYTNLFKSNEGSLSADILKPRLGDNLKMYFPDEREKDITDKVWRSAYTLGLELGVFFKVETNPAKYALSTLGERLQKSQITASQFIASYLLNLNQLINNQIVHPLEVVLDYMQDMDLDTISRNNIIEIPLFNLQRQGITQKNQRQIANIFLHRLVESHLFTEVSSNTSVGRVVRLSDRYSLYEIKSNIKKFQGSIDDFKEINAQSYLEMISFKNDLVQ